MNIVVCLKQVPDSTQVKVDPQTGTLIRAGVPSILNPYDHFALETALELKKKHSATITLVSMGPAQAKAILRLGLALGADRAVLLCDRAFAGSDTWATSYAISKGIKKLGKVDLILCGMMAIDGDTAQTGPAIAQQLHMPQITFCESVLISGRKLTAKKLIDGGHEILEAALPVLCTMVMPHGYAPAQPSFTQIGQAQEKQLDLWTAMDVGADENLLGLKGSPTRVDRVYAPPQRERGEVYQGTPAEMVEKLVSILKEENFIKP
jgi:electron transfer flavoprotein beta subunit